MNAKKLLVGPTTERMRNFRLFADEDVESVHVDSGYVYVVTADRQQTANRVRVVDVATGKVVREATPADRPIDFAFN